MKLSEYLDIKKINAAEFAGLLPDASEASVRKWASGERIPRAEVMRAIVAATGGWVTPNDFFGVVVRTVAVEDSPTEGN